MLNNEMVAAWSLQVLFRFLFYDDNEWIIEARRVKFRAQLKHVI
jgi:hypothetical protein